MRIAKTRTYYKGMQATVMFYLLSLALIRLASILSAVTNREQELTLAGNTESMLKLGKEDMIIFLLHTYT